MLQVQILETPLETIQKTLVLGGEGHLILVKELQEFISFIIMIPPK